MADVKITGLSAISTISTANDPLPIVDVSDTSMATTGTTKKITIDQVMASGAAGTFSSATVTGVITASAGTVGAPAITTTGDTNTGVYFPAADTVSITTGGSERSRVDSNGVEIVGGTSAYTSFRNSSGTFSPKIQSQDTSVAGIGVVTGTTTRNSISMFVDDPGGAVGISTNHTSTGFASAPALQFYAGGILKALIPGAAIVNNEGFTVFDNDAVLNGRRVGKGRGNVSTNLAIGGIDNTTPTGTYNTAIGSVSLNSLTTGQANTCVGYESLRTVSTGSSNTAVGYQAGLSNNGSQNTFVGSACGKGGSDNSALGSSALLNCTSSNNVAIGSGAATVMTSGTATAVGKAALVVATTGLENTAIGFQSQLLLTTGNRNTSVGAGSGGTVTTGSDNTALGYNTSWGAATASSRIAIGKGVTATANSRVTIGIDSNIAELDLDGSDTSWAASSDERLKKNVQDLGAGLSFLTALRPVSFQWRTKREVPAELANLHADSDDSVHGDASKIYHGFIAQEVKSVIDAHPEVVSGQHFWEVREDGVQTLAPADLVPILVKAIKELSSRVQALENA